MDNGHYDYAITMQTPLGHRRGRLELAAKDTFLNGALTMFGQTTPIRNGSLVQGTICFEGEMRVFRRPLPYKAGGMLNASGIKMVLTTQQGTYPVVGEAVPARRW